MGLDMNVYATSERLNAQVDFTCQKSEEIAYWRKHPNLHGWMERLYREKGGTAESFNYVNVLLTAEDLDRLESDIKKKALPKTSGFFFGTSDGSEVDDDLAFIARAREQIAEGKSIYYSSLW